MKTYEMMIALPFRLPENADEWTIREAADRASDLAAQLKSDIQFYGLAFDNPGVEKVVEELCEEVHSWARGAACEDDEPVYPTCRALLLAIAAGYLTQAHASG